MRTWLGNLVDGTIGVVKKCVWLLVGALIAYAAITVWGNFVKPAVSTPTMEKAQYGVYVLSTRQALLTNRYEQQGCIYTLHGFYEPQGKGYHYVKGTLMIDEATWGPVVVSKRTK